VWGFGKLAVESLQEAIAQVGIGGLDIGDAVSRQQCYQPILQRAK